MADEDKASSQLQDYLNKSKKTLSVTTTHGTPIGIKQATLTVGPRGPILLEDVSFIQEIAHFNRERIPERVVHAKGAGAFGYFEVTHDITDYTAVKVFEYIGKKTPIAVRFSTVSGENGSPDTVRDPRGFAIKFYTEDGIWDLVGNNAPVFFFRDPILFPSFIHTLKRNPQTHLRDPNMFWDFVSLRPETMHHIMMLFGDRGIPDGYRYMNGYGTHTYKLVNNQGHVSYCKFHFKTDQGSKNLDPKIASDLTQYEQDYAIKDLYNAIANQNYPSWTFYVQIMKEEQISRSSFDPLDITKAWPQKLYPLLPVGKLVLNRNPENYFAEVEQIAFCPAHMVPGIQPTHDKILLGRMFAYGDTQRHRLGANYLQLPVNCPFKVQNYQRDGPQAIHNQGSAPNYHPNSFNGPENDSRADKLSPPFHISGDVMKYDKDDLDNFSQPREYYQRVLDEPARDRLVANIVDSLKNTVDFIQERTVKVFSQVDKSFGQKIHEALKNYHNIKSSL